MSTPFDSATPPLRTFPEGMLAYVWNDIRTSVFTADERMVKKKAWRMIEPWTT